MRYLPANKRQFSQKHDSVSWLGFFEVMDSIPVRPKYNGRLTGNQIYVKDQTPAERKLWRSVMLQALMDSLIVFSNRREPKKWCSYFRQKDHSTAVIFLFSNLPQWRAHRFWVCHNAGYDPHDFEERLRKRLAKVPDDILKKAEEALGCRIR